MQIPPSAWISGDSGFLTDVEADSKGKKKMTAELDPYHRFDWGVPPTSKGDYAFVLHMLASLDAENGRMAIVLPHGVLFRGASEGKIRRQLVEMNLLDAVIGLPPICFMVPAFRPAFWCSRKIVRSGMCCLSMLPGRAILRRARTRIFFATPTLPGLSPPTRSGRTVDKYSYLASLDEIRENDFNLNIPRYVDTFEEEELVDIDEVQRNIANIEAELAQVQAQMKQYLEELGL